MSFSRNTRRLTAVAGAVAVLAAAGCSSSADEATGSNGATVDRAATGELSSNGGARRIDGDQSAAVRDAVNASGAKNVILLIGTAWATRRSPPHATTPKALRAASPASTPCRSPASTRTTH